MENSFENSIRARANQLQVKIALSMENYNCACPQKSQVSRKNPISQNNAPNRNQSQSQSHFSNRRIVQFCDTISVATQVGISSISNTIPEKIQSYKNTRGKVHSIFLQLQWNSTKKKKKKTTIAIPWKIPIIKNISNLPGININSNIATMDPKTKTITRKIQISLANNSYEKLQNDEDTTPTK